MPKYLARVTDDPRVKVDPRMYDIIHKSLRYYRGDEQKVKYLPSIDNDDTRKAPHMKERVFDSLNMTKRMSARLASIVFGKQAEYSFQDNAVGDYINGIFVDNQFNDLLEQNLEKGIALGGFAARPYVENNKIKIAWCDAEQFYPLKSNISSIQDAVIVSKTIMPGETQDTNTYYTLLEFHEWQNNGDYVITNELYKSDDAINVGNQVPLSDLYPDMQASTTFTGITKPLFAYFKMPGSNNKVLDSPLGLGIVPNNEHTLKNISIVHDNLLWEIKTGKRTVLVPPEYIEFDDLHRPKFNTETDAFVAINGMDNDKPQELNMDIRIQEYDQTMQFYLRELEAGCGVSAGTFSTSATAMQTATQVVSENSMTYQTRESILTMLDKFINDLCIAILEMGSTAQLFSNHQAQISDVDFDNIGLSIHHDDSVFVDANTQQDQDLKAVAGGVMSKKTFLMRNYGMSAEDAEKELTEIQSEQQTNTNNMVLDPISKALNGVESAKGKELPTDNNDAENAQEDD
ncbi:MAG: phage portal protein [Candidatus Paralactobacillus gallistercoris]|uniref:Phage portal protein n=1 Tax=Candidatus Paralactobacillus gallistercoris TaxID=2838724 RepID=A0A948TIH6_9LACO|nr:phage portal protein [Candidatus Paralactobacillus gallistercoris]